LFFVIALVGRPASTCEAPVKTEKIGPRRAAYTLTTILTETLLFPIT